MLMWVLKDLVREQNIYMTLVLKCISCSNSPQCKFTTGLVWSVLTPAAYRAWLRSWSECRWQFVAGSWLLFSCRFFLLSALLDQLFDFMSSFHAVMFMNNNEHAFLTMSHNINNISYFSYLNKETLPYWHLDQFTMCWLS